MEEFNHLESIKENYGFENTDHHDATLKGHIDEVVEYLIDAGVPESVVMSKRCKGIVSRGVDDLWTSDSGKAALSPYFKERAAQLALKWGAKNGQT